MCALYRAPALRAWGLITEVCIAGSFLTGCNAPDDMQGPPGVTGVDVGIQLSAVPTGGLVGEWKLDGNVNDNTANNFDATLFGNPPYIDAQIGQGLDLTGNGTGGQGVKYVEMPLDPTLNDLSEGSAYSISAWFNPASAPSGTAPSNFWMVVGKTNMQAIGIVYNPVGKFAARHYLDGNVLRLATATSTSTLNQWHHVVAVVTKGSSTVSGSLKLYVDGQLSDTDTWAGGTPAKDFGMVAKWRIGKSDDDWSAHGRVDQVRFYDDSLSQSDVTNLFQETASLPIFRFPVGMAKEQNSDLGTDAYWYNPDGKRNAIGTSMLPTLRYARQHGARVIMTVTGADNQNLRTDPNNKSSFVKATWMSRFNDAAAAISPDTVRDYLKDGTLIGIYVIDEPWSDFTSFTYQTLDSLCQHVKASWPWAPCIARTDNTVIHDNTPATYKYRYLDAGWAQTTEFKVRTSPGHTVQSYFQTNLDVGETHDLGLWYGFNLINYVNTAQRPGCTPSFDNGQHCAITADELKAVANAIEAIGSGKGCGVSGWFLDNAVGPERNYFFNAGINDALKYLWNHTAGRNPAIQPGPCNIRGDLPAP
jgi:hypothetical protein